MKRLSIYLPVLALAIMLALSGTAKTPESLPPLKTVKANPPKPIPPSSLLSFPLAHMQYMYYWYTSPDDTYNDYKTLSDETWEWILMLGGASVDTNPMGGTLLAVGYMTNNYPHIAYPSIYLYVHLTQ